MAKFSINKSLITMKLSYFLLYAGIASLLPYISIIMGQVGLSPIDLAKIFGVVMAVTGPVRLIIGYLVDKYGNTSFVFLGACILTALFHLVLYFVPTAYVSTKVLIEKTVELVHICTNNETLLCSNQMFRINNSILIECGTGSCSNKSLSTSTENYFMFNDSCLESRDNYFCLNSNNFTLLSVENNTQLIRDNQKHQNVFLSFFILLLFGQSCLCPLGNMLDAVNYKLLGRESYKYGRQRFWGSIGFGTLAILSGLIIDAIKQIDEPQAYLFPFVTYSVFMILNGIIVFIEVRTKFDKIADGSKLCKSEKEIFELKNTTSIRISPKLDKNFIDNMCDDSFNDNSLSIPFNHESNANINKLLATEMDNGIKKTNGFSIDFKTNEKIKDVTKSKNILSENIEVEVNGHLNDEISENICHITEKTKSKVVEKDFKDDKLSFLQVIKILLGNFYLNVIILSVLVAGFMAAALEGFFFYFLSKDLKAIQSVVGICLLSSCLCESIVMFFSGKIIKKLTYKVSLYLVFIVFFIRFGAMSFIYNPWFAVITEALQCICFGLLYPTVTQWAVSVTPTSLINTTQCYIGSVYFSIGRSLGAIASGIIYELYTARFMFRLYAIISISYFGVLVILFELVDRYRKKNNENIN